MHPIAGKTSVTIGVPVYQNSGSLRGLVDEIRSNFSAALPQIRVDIVFVDDGSTDGSSEVLAALADEHPDFITVVTFTRNFGQLYALIAAIDHARGDAVICVSADQQDPITAAVTMVRAWLGGAEIVIAHREAREDHFSARLYSKLAYGLLRLSTPSIPKGGSDYFLLGSRAAAHIRAKTNRNRFFVTDILSLGYQVAFVPYVRRARRHGKSQYTLVKKIKSLIDAVVDSSYLPIRVMSTIGMVFVAASVLYSISIAIGRLRGTVPADGFAVIVILLLMIGGLIIMMLGILGEYVWRIYDEVRSRPLYLVETIKGPATPALHDRSRVGVGPPDHKEPGGKKA